MSRKHAVLRITYEAFFSAFAGVLLLVMPNVAFAQAAQSSGQFNIPFGKSYDDSSQPFDPRTRDANGNRSIVNGRIINGNASSLPFGIGGDFFGSSNSGVGGIGSAGAIGNQLNVVTIGSWNTVIIDSTQINNGDQNVNLSGQTQNPHHQNPPPPPPMANDGPFTAGSAQSTQNWQVVDPGPTTLGPNTLGPNTLGTRVSTKVPGELNGEIKLND